MALGKSEEILSNSISGSFGALEWKLLIPRALENIASVVLSKPVKLDECRNKEGWLLLLIDTHF